MIRSVIGLIIALVVMNVVATPPVRAAEVAGRIAALAEIARSTTASPHNLPDAAREAERIGKSLEAEGDRKLAGEAFRVAGALALRGSLFDQSLTDSAAAERNCRVAGDQLCVSKALNNAGIALARKGDLDAAAARLLAAADISARIGDGEGMAASRLNAALILRELDRREEALAALDDIERSYDKPDLLFVALVNKARVLLDLKRYPEAERAAMKAYAITPKATGHGNPVDAGCSALRTVAMARARQKQDSSVALFQQCLDRANASGNRHDIHEAQLGFAEGLIALGRGAEAAPHAQAALADPNLSSERERADTLQVAATAYAAAGDFKTAMKLADQAFQASETIGKSRNASAAATAINRIAVIERQAAAQRAIAEAATQQAENERRIQQLRIIGMAIIGSLLVAAASIIGWYRLRQQRLRSASVMAERTRLARDMHDTLLQGLTGISMQLGAMARDRAVLPEGSEAADRLRALARQAQDCADEARNAVWGMRAPLMLDGDLPALVTDWIAAARATTQAELKVEVENPFPKLAPDRTEALFRTVQEAVSNALRHGEPHHVRVTLGRRGKDAAVTIADDGKGFDAAVPGTEGHWGLVGMRERVERLKGSLTIASQAGQGAKVEALLPL